MMKKMSDLKKGTLSRSLFAIKSGLKILPSVLNIDHERPEQIFKRMIGSNIEAFVDEVGSFKGSLLKAAQLLSVYGEYYLPVEINHILKKVQSQSHYLEWDKIKKYIPEQLLETIDIENSPLAAASIGQVHRGQIKKTGEWVALKIQYPGVREAIDLDLKMLKIFFSLGRIFPQKMDLSGIWEEVRRVLVLEMDYAEEISKQKRYRELLAHHPYYYIPKIYPDLSGENVIVSEYVEGRSLGEISPATLTQEECNQLGHAILYLFFVEVFRGNLVQTDCHAGNFLVAKRENQLRLVLIDFGACLYYPDEKLIQYRKLVTSIFHKRREDFFTLFRSITENGKAGVQVNPDLLWEYCLLAASPLQSEDYDWGRTDLADVLFSKGLELARTTHIEKPPHDFIFLDRKLLGIFSILKSLQARFNVKELVEEFIGES